MGRTLIKCSVVFILLSVFSATSHARSFSKHSGHNRFVDKGLTLAVGYNTGGDTLTTVDGKEVTAGSGTSYHIGGNVDFPVSGSGSRLSLQATIGVREDESASESIYFITAPIDVLAYYQKNNYRLGAGVAYHLTPRFQNGASTEINFESQPGFILAAELVEQSYTFFRFALSARYTFISYTPEFGSYISPDDGSTVTEVNGNSGGLFLSLHW